MALKRVKTCTPRLDAALWQEDVGGLPVVSAEVHHVVQFQNADMGIGGVARRLNEHAGGAANSANRAGTCVEDKSGAANCVEQGSSQVTRTAVAALEDE